MLYIIHHIDINLISLQIYIDQLVEPNTEMKTRNSLDTKILQKIALLYSNVILYHPFILFYQPTFFCYLSPSIFSTSKPCCLFTLLLQEPTFLSPVMSCRLRIMFSLDNEEKVLSHTETWNKCGSSFCTYLASTNNIDLPQLM